MALNHTQSIVKWGCQYCEQLLRTLFGFGYGAGQGTHFQGGGVPDNTSFFTTLNRRQLLDKTVDTIVSLFNVLTQR